MTKREELLNTIKQSKKAKAVSIFVILIGLASYFFFDAKQVNAEKELLILDQGKLDQMVLK